MSSAEQDHQEQRLSHFTIEKAADAILWIDTDFRLFRVNEAACQLFGYSRDELLSMTIYDILVDYSAERGARYWGRLKKMRMHNFETEHRRKDGRIIPVGVTNNFIEFDGKEYICSFLRDHAERRRAAEKLEENRRFLLEAQRVAHLGFWVWDIVENVVTWSDELYRIYGLNPEEFGASYEGFLDRIHPDDRERVRGLVDGSYQNRTPLDFYHRIVRSDGTICTLHAHGEVTTDEANNPIRMVGTALDVTELVKAEEEIRKLNAELEQRVQERTAELESTLQRLKETQNQLVLREKMASLGNLVAGVAHEINNPMAAVKSASDVSRRCAQQLKEIIEQGSSAQVILDNRHFQKAIRLLMKNAEIAVEGSDRITKIIRSLKTFARLDVSELDKADIHEGLESTLTLLHHELKNKTEVIRNYGDIPRIYCYPQELNQVFMNLLSNAIQAIEKKGTIRIKTSTDAENVYVMITDTGKGIPPEKLNKIFDPGFTTKGVGIGTGLGLSISHNIIRKHQGKIAVESTVGKGTKFTITLPIVPRT